MASRNCYIEVSTNMLEATIEGVLQNRPKNVSKIYVRGGHQFLHDLRSYKSKFNDTFNSSTCIFQSFSVCL